MKINHTGKRLTTWFVRSGFPFNMLALFQGHLFKDEAGADEVLKNLGGMFSITQLINRHAYGEALEITLKQ